MYTVVLFISSLNILIQVVVYFKVILYVYIHNIYDYYKVNIIQICYLYFLHLFKCRHYLVVVNMNL